MHFPKLGLWDNERKPISIRMDAELYKAFKPVAQRVFGSVCCAIEGYMAGILGAIQNGEVHLGNTIRIDGGMHVHRYGLKKRRMLFDGEADGESVDPVILDRCDTLLCHYRGMDEWPSPAKVLADIIAVWRDEDALCVEDRILLKDMVLRELSKK